MRPRGSEYAALPRVLYRYHFDTVGVPSRAEMDREVYAGKRMRWGRGLRQPAIVVVPRDACAIARPASG